MESNPQPSGYTLGFHEFGVFVFMCSILVQNLKVLTFSSSFYAANILTIFISILLCILSVLILSSMTSDDYYGIFPM